VLDSPPPELDSELTSGAQSPSGADLQRDAYFSEIRQFIGQACGTRSYVGAPAPLLPAAAPSKWFLQPASRYGASSAEGRGERGRSPCELEDDELDWEDGETAATRPPLNGSWSGHRRLMAALSGGPTSVSSAGGGRTMLHSLLAMTTGDRAYPSMPVSPTVKSPTRPASSALKQPTNVAPPCVF